MATGALPTDEGEAYSYTAHVQPGYGQAWNGNVYYTAVDPKRLYEMRARGLNGTILTPPDGRAFTEPALCCSNGRYLAATSYAPDRTMLLPVEMVIDGHRRSRVPPLPLTRVASPRLRT